MKLAIAGLSLFVFSATAQVSLLTNNITTAAPYVGSDAASTVPLNIFTKANNPIYLGTSNINRVRLNQSLLNSTYNTFTNQNFGGFMCLSKDGLGLPNPAAESQLHFYSGNLSTGLTGNYRPNEQNSLTMNGNNDVFKVGQRVEAGSNNTTAMFRIYNG